MTDLLSAEAITQLLEARAARQPSRRDTPPSLRPATSAVITPLARRRPVPSQIACPSNDEHELELNGVCSICGAVDLSTAA